MRFDSDEIAPRAATLIRNMGLLFLPEVICDAGRMDFLTLHPTTGQVAIVECKTSIPSPMGVINQIDRYHESFGLEIALKWAFSWHAIPQKRIETFSRYGVSYYHIDNTLPKSANKLGQHQRYDFIEAFYRFHPLHDFFPFYTSTGRCLHPEPDLFEDEPVITPTIKFAKPTPSPFNMPDYDREEG